MVLAVSKTTMVAAIGLVAGSNLTWFSELLRIHLTAERAHSDPDTFKTVLTLVAVTLLTINIHHRILDLGDWEEVLERSIILGLTCALCFAFAGLLATATARILPMTGFQNVGPFTIAMLILIGIVFIWSLVRLGFRRTKTSTY